MVRTYLDQPVIRYFDGEADGHALVCNEPDGEPSGVWLAPKSIVYAYDAPLYQAMLAYDPILDEEPVELRELWQRCAAFFPRADDEAAG